MNTRACLRPALLPLCCAALSASAHAQATPAASRIGDVQIGVGYVRADPDYSPNTFSGFAIFGDIDPYNHFGAEASFHHISGLTPTLTENTYEGGLRYKYPIGPISPYLRLSAGAGTFAFGSSSQNGTYLMYSGGGGVDALVFRNYVVRADFEYQRWGNFPPRGLQPNLASVGVAYRFH